MELLFGDKEERYICKTLFIVGDAVVDEVLIAIYDRFGKEGTDHELLGRDAYSLQHWAGGKLKQSDLDEWVCDCTPILVVAASEIHQGVQVLHNKVHKVFAVVSEETVHSYKLLKELSMTKDSRYLQIDSVSVAVSSVALIGGKERQRMEAKDARRSRRQRRQAAYEACSIAIEVAQQKWALKEDARMRRECFAQHEADGLEVSEKMFRNMQAKEKLATTRLQSLEGKLRLLDPAHMILSMKTWHIDPEVIEKLQRRLARFDEKIAEHGKEYQLRKLREGTDSDDDDGAAGNADSNKKGKWAYVDSEDSGCDAPCDSDMEDMEPDFMEECVHSMTPRFMQSTGHAQSDAMHSDAFTESGEAETGGNEDLTAPLTARASRVLEECKEASGAITARVTEAAQNIRGHMVRAGATAQCSEELLGETQPNLEELQGKTSQGLTFTIALFETERSFTLGPVTVLFGPSTENKDNTVCMPEAAEADDCTDRNAWCKHNTPLSALMKLFSVSEDKACAENNEQSSVDDANKLAKESIDADDGVDEEQAPPQTARTPRFIHTARWEKSQTLFHDATSNC